MADPERAERFWLAVAIATLWAVSVGGEAEAAQPLSGLEHLPETRAARRRAPRRAHPRLLSCAQRGVLLIVAAMIAIRSLPLGCFVPQPWPTFLSASGP